MASGVQLSKNGAVYGTGSQLDVRTVGFRPRRVELLNEDGLARAIWLDSMTEGRGFKTITDGTLSEMAADEGISPLSDGFRLGVDADMNVSGELLHWVAHE